jgi:hypothetical protein
MFFGYISAVAMMLWTHMLSVVMDMIDVSMHGLEQYRTST